MLTVLLLSVDVVVVVVVVFLLSLVVGFHLPRLLVACAEALQGLPPVSVMEGVQKQANACHSLSGRLAPVSWTCRFCTTRTRIFSEDWRAQVEDFRTAGWRVVPLWHSVGQWIK